MITPPEIRDYDHEGTTAYIVWPMVNRILELIAIGIGTHLILRCVDRFDKKAGNREAELG